jgi:hypothetical protein
MNLKDYITDFVTYAFLIPIFYYLEHKKVINIFLFFILIFTFRNQIFSFIDYLSYLYYSSGNEAKLSFWGIFLGVFLSSFFSKLLNSKNY